MLRYLIPLVAFASSVARADDRCVTHDEAQAWASEIGAGELVSATDAQWQFMRGAYVVNPDTPTALPPGDRGAFARAPHTWGVWFFVDGDLYCSRLKVSGEIVDILMQVGAGEITHTGEGL